MKTQLPERCDFLVFGGGAAGLMAALVAQTHGLKTLLCEINDQIGGTTATSGGTVWLPGNAVGARAGVPDTLDAARTYLNAEIGARDAEMREAFFEGGRSAVAFLEKHSCVRFKANVPYPDYHTDQPGAAMAGRAITPLPFDGRRLQGKFGLIRPPIDEFMALGGMMAGRNELAMLFRPWASLPALRLTLRLGVRQLLDRLRYPRGTRLHLGNALIASLSLSYLEAGGQIAVSTGLVKLVRRGGRVAGAIVKQDGQRREISAEKGVMLATGGFASNPDARLQWIGDGIAQSAAVAEAKGAGVNAGRAAGGVVDEDHLTPAFWMPASLIPMSDGSAPHVFPHIRDRPKPGMIAVDVRGRRFVNESASYHDFVIAMFGIRRHWPIQLICDREFVRRYGLGPILPTWQRLGRWVRSGYLKFGDTIEELARAIGVDALALEETVSRHNADAARGVDEAFGKGSTEYNRVNGDRGRAPNPCLAPIKHPPFLAVTVHPVPIGTSLGLKCDTDARVLDARGLPVEGLYAGGNDMSSLMRGRYPGPGITLGPHLAFAFRAAVHVCSSC